MERGLACFENITNAADGVDQFVPERIVHLCAQTAHNDIDHVRVSFESDVPDLFCNFSARYYFAGRANQMREQEKLLRCEIERNARTRCLVPSHIDLQIIDAQMFCLSLRSAP